MANWVLRRSIRCYCQQFARSFSKCWRVGTSSLSISTRLPSWLARIAMGLITPMNSCLKLPMWQLGCVGEPGV